METKQTTPTMQATETKQLTEMEVHNNEMVSICEHIIDVTKTMGANDPQVIKIREEAETKLAELKTILNQK